MGETDTEWAKRLRAARGYAGKSSAEMGELLGMSDSTYKRVEGNPDHYNGRKREAFLSQVAKATGVPETFFERGWPDGSPSDAERLEALDHQYAALKGELQKEQEDRRSEQMELAARLLRLEQGREASRPADRRQEPREESL